MNRCWRTGCVLLVLLLGQSGCATRLDPRVAASPFEVGASVYAAVLDAITIREVVGLVKIVPKFIESPGREEFPLPVHWSSMGDNELDGRRREISAMGFALDSIAETGDCPGFWSTADMRTGCPTSSQTTILVSRSRMLSSIERATVKERYSRGVEPESAVTLLFVVSTPAGAAVVVSEYYVCQSRQGFWVVVGKRVLFQTE